MRAAGMSPDPSTTLAEKAEGERGGLGCSVDIGVGMRRTDAAGWRVGRQASLVQAAALASVFSPFAAESRCVWRKA